MSLTLSEVQPGDIVIYMPSYKKDDLIADHAGIITRVNLEDNECWVTHAATGKYNEVIETLLRPEDHTSYMIWRCADQALARRAAALMLLWSTMGIPYAQDRINRLYDMEEHFNADSKPAEGLPLFLEAAEASYRENFFRVIKYAARRDTRISRHKGLSCAELAVLAFQVAEVAPFVSSLDRVGVTWVTDKYSSDQYDRMIREMPFFDSYNAYRSRLRTSSEFAFFPQPNKQYAPRKESRFSSAMVWDEELIPDPRPWFLSEYRVFRLDSKLTTPSLLRFYMQENSQHWSPMGFFAPDDFVKTPHEKDLWRARMDYRSELTQSLSRDLIRRFSFSEPFCFSPPLEEEIEPFSDDMMSPVLRRARSQSWL